MTENPKSEIRRNLETRIAWWVALSRDRVIRMDATERVPPFWKISDSDFVRISDFGFRILFLTVWLVISASVSDAATLRGTVIPPKGFPTAAETVIFIEQIPDKKFAPPEKPLVMDQRGYKFVPHILPVLVGSTVAFPNSDPDVHNAYSASDCCKFDLGHYPRGESRSVKFEKVGVAEILCNIHPQMGAYVIVLQNPFYFVTDKSGAFEIRDVPAGEYTLVVWHEVLPSIRQKITVGDDDLDFKFELQTWTPIAPPQPPKEMALIPAGEFVMGADDRLPNEKPRRTVKLPAFWMDRAEVTNAQFCDFLNAFRNNREEEGVRWINLDDPDCKIRAGEKRGEFVVEEGFENHPVVCVSWYGAAAYAKWLGKRLPTEAEWERAARGTDGREFPWGNQIGAGKANISLPAAPSKETRAVGSFPDGASAEGCLDLAGNVWEWTADDFRETPDAKLDEKFPRKTIRGGAFDSPPSFARGSVRIGVDPTHRSHKVGFRCAKDSK
jgi:formylglycine-generating enzyme required for sulfatase activity/plastocyanin